MGRAPGSDGLTAAALAYGNPLGIEYYPAKVKDLVAFVSGKKAFTEAFERLRATPNTHRPRRTSGCLDRASTAPSMRVTSVSRSPFAHFIAPEATVAAMRRYRDEFKDEHLPAPYSSVGVFAIATEDPERADLFRRVREIQRIRRDQGYRGPPPTLEEAAATPFSDEDMDRLRSKRSRQIIGSGAEVKSRDRCAR